MKSKKIARRPDFEGQIKLPKILVILGPTATGKSDFAVQLAKQFDGEIISADSRQVYKGLDLGTGKITKKEMLGVPHYGLDLVSPIGTKTRFTVADFQKYAYEKIDDILSRGKLPILCGGTGFYIQSIVDGTVLPEVSPNPKLRDTLAKKSTEKLMAILSKLDPSRARDIDAQNPVRLIRAIEIAKQLGKVPAIKTAPKYNALCIGLDMNDELLKERILKRIHSRIKKGMIREAVDLHKKGLGYAKMRELGLEYRHLAELLQTQAKAQNKAGIRAGQKAGKLADKSAGQKKLLLSARKKFIELLNIDIWHYAKRQRAWFKRDERVMWVEPMKDEGVLNVKKKVSYFVK